jgi:hypothetical protein
MATSIDLISNVYNLLAKTFSVSGTSNCLQMAWPGLSLSPADFKPFDNPQGPYDSQVAEETFSHLANMAPLGNPLLFENSGFEIDDLYQILLWGAIPSGADPNALLANPAYKLFSDAQYEFVRVQKGSARDPNAFYYPCQATPTNWYTEESAQFWPTVSLSSAQIKPPEPGSLFVKAGGPTLLSKGVWQLPPTNVDSAAIDKQLRATITSKSAVLGARFKPAAGAAVIAKPALVHGAAAVRMARPAPGPRAGSLTIDDAVVAARLAEVSAVPSAKVNLRPTLGVGRLDGLPQIAIDAKRFEPVRSKTMTIERTLAIRSLLGQMLTPKPVAPATDGFSISFKFCRVNIDRGAWFKTALLAMRNWYMLNTKAGEYALGQLEPGSGMFPMIADSFIAIRDLKITANWSQQDRDTASQAKSFGPFDTRGGTMNQNTFEAKGLQIVAWTSRLNPMLPPLKDPGLPA